MAIAALLATVLFLVSGVFPWSPLNCWHEEVDIHSGRICQTWLLLYCQVSQREKETWLSRAVVKSSKSPEWHRVNTFSPGTRHSPHYRYHGAIHQIRSLEQIDQLIPFEPSARRRVASHLLALWQKGSYNDADPYIEDVANVAFALHDRGARTVSEADLPECCTSDVGTATPPSDLR